MCGLYGMVSSSLNKGDVALTKELGLLSTLRGQDSAGVGLAYRLSGKANRNKTYFTSLKSTQMAPAFLNSKDFNQCLDSFQNTMCIMGHTRLATQGTIRQSNAHPFTEGNIIGAHNGTIWKFKDREKKDETDSQELIEQIAHNGIDKALTEAGEYGCWALSYIDTEENTLNLCRNDKRPLSYMLTQDNKRLMWASDPIFLEFMKARSDLKWANVTELDKNVLYTWSFNNCRFTTRKLDINFKSTVFLPSRSHTTPPWSEDRNCGTRTQQTGTPMSNPIVLCLPLLKGVTENSVEPATKVFNSTPGLGYPRCVILNEHRKILRFVDFHGNFRSLEQLNENLIGGCMVSGKVADYNDKIRWITEDEYFLDIYGHDRLVQDELASRNVGIPKLGQGVYVSHLLLAGAARKEKDKEIMLEMAKKQLKLNTEWDPAYGWHDEEDDEAVPPECH